MQFIEQNGGGPGVRGPGSRTGSLVQPYSPVISAPVLLCAAVLLGYVAVGVACVGREGPGGAWGGQAKVSVHQTALDPI